MIAVPVAIPLAWSNHQPFYLLSHRIDTTGGSDCLSHRRTFR